MTARFKTMGPACPCEEDVVCTIFSDDFATDRTGTDYSVRSGSWSVAAGLLTCTSSLGLIREETAYDVAATACHLTVTMTMASTSDIGRIIFAYVDDNNYWYVEVQPGATNGTIKLYERSGGVDTQRNATVSVPTLTAGTPAAVCVSYTPSNVKATAQVTAGLGYVTFSSSITIASTKGGLGTGSGSSSVSFDDFYVNQHSTDEATCSRCVVCCDGYTIPSTIFNELGCGFTLTGAHGGVAFCDGGGFSHWDRASCGGFSNLHICCINGTYYLVSQNIFNPLDFGTIRATYFMVSCSPFHAVGTYTVGGAFAELTE